MNLEQTPESIVPEQSVIDSWPTKVRIASHPCQEQQGCEHHPSKCCECMLKEIDEEYLNWISDEEKHLKAALISINEVP